jgi:bifunctional non-homologous end joining protein LigD
VITHPEKLLFPDSGITKRELAAYYEAVAPVMLPHLRRRPITMERFPSGIGQPGFLQKDVVRGFPEWLKRIEAPKKGGTVHYVLANDRRSLLWLANQNTIAVHVWTSRAPRLDRPDLCVFDLDPSADDPGALRTAALRLRELLDEHGVASWVKTSGSKGFHIVVPLDARTSFDQSARFAGRVAGMLADRHPMQFTLASSKAQRDGKILIDIGRNHAGATVVAPYSVRPKPGAPVSAPCTWAEIESGHVGPRTFTVRTLLDRLDRVGDLWQPIQRRVRASPGVRRLSRV